jgi:hypothetical protein
VYNLIPGDGPHAGSRSGGSAQGTLETPMPESLPAFARVDRSLAAGDHPFLGILPGVAASPALVRIVAEPVARARLLDRALVQIRGDRGYAFVDVERPCIVLSERYFREGEEIDIYLDLLHELTHLRQLEDGCDLWDERFAYVDRPTEVEGYAVAIEEGRRLAMTDLEIVDHLSNPWMTADEVARLLRHVDTYLAGGGLPNLDEARRPAPSRPHRPW